MWINIPDWDTQESAGPQLSYRKGINFHVLLSGVFLLATFLNFNNQIKQLKTFLKHTATGICLMTLSVFTSCKPVATEDDALEVNRQGVAYMNEGNYELALESFAKAVKSTKLSISSKGAVYRNMSISYLSLDNNDSSFHYSSLAAKCFAKNSYNYLVNMADVDLVTGRTGEAAKKLIKAFELEPDNMSANNTLGLIFLGEYDEAYLDLETALIYNKRAFELKRDRVTEEVLARNYYQLENYEQADRHYSNLLVNYSDMSNYLFYAGMTKFRLDKRAEADELFDKLIAADSTYTESVENFKAVNY